MYYIDEHVHVLYRYILVYILLRKTTQILKICFRHLVIFGHFENCIAKYKQKKMIEYWIVNLILNLEFRELESILTMVRELYCT